MLPQFSNEEGSLSLASYFSYKSWTDFPAKIPDFPTGRQHPTSFVNISKRGKPWMRDETQGLFWEYLQSYQVTCIICINECSFKFKTDVWIRFEMVSSQSILSRQNGSVSSETLTVKAEENFSGFHMLDGMLVRLTLGSGVC